MLNITAQQNAAGAKSYFAQADYYSQGQEVTGRWYGAAANLLGLEGLVTQADFHSLCDNLHPQTGEPLTAKTLENRRVGYDFTWSAPKSVSIVQALTGDERILAAWQASIHETMSEMEREMATRVRKRGQDTDRMTGNWVYAEFLHHTSRPVNGIPAPQLHSHTFVFNATHDAVEDQWKAGQFGPIKEYGYYWQATQQVRFAHALQELGYGIRRTKDAFEITGVPASAIQKFSPRTRQIEAAAARLGITNPKLKAKLGATTREAKNAEIPYTDLIEIWKTWVDPEANDAIQTTKHPEPQWQAERSKEAIRFALDHHLERNSVVDERRVLATALKEAIGSTTPETLHENWQQQLLLKKREGTRTVISTPEVLATETTMLNAARNGKGTCRPLAAGQEIEFQRSILNDEQRQAIRHILTSSDKIMLLRGAAGTGKTTLTKEAVEQLNARGKPVVMLAPSAKASRGVLRDEGFGEADTLAKFLGDREFQAQAKDGVIWLDEASFVGTKSMNQLFQVSEGLNARVVCAGDKWQHGSIERSSALPALESLAGLPVAEIRTIQRQRPADYRSAVELLSQGKTELGLAALEKQGSLKILPAEELHASVAEEYLALRASSNDKHNDVAIVCPTHAEAADVTLVLRERMKEQALLGNDERNFTQLISTQWTQAERANAALYQGDELLQFHHNTGPYKAGQRIRLAHCQADLGKLDARHFSVYTESTVPFAPGDRIRLTANGKTLDGKRLNNGDIHTFTGYTKTGDLILDNIKIVSQNFGHWAHGLVSTSQASQGRTVEHVLLVQSGKSHLASSREGLYVAASRGRQSVSIFTDSKEDLLAAAERSEGKRSATEVFTANPSRAPAWDRVRQQLRRSQQRVMIAAKVAARELHETLVQVREPSYDR
jgi:conjugative relaxase-like TrwC/TraI family protein